MTTLNSRVLSRQISAAESLLVTRLTEYQETMKLSRKNPSKDKSGMFTLFIRLLDLEADGKNLDESAAVVFPEKWNSKALRKDDNKVVRDQVRTLRARAHEYAEELYRELATRPEVPELKGSK